MSDRKKKKTHRFTCQFCKYKERSVRTAGFKFCPCCGKAVKGGG